MAFNFNEALNKKMGEIERPPLLPQGTYQAKVSKVAAMDSISDGAWDTLDFPMLLVKPGEDVPEDDLTAFGGLATKDGKPYVVRNHRFMFDTADKVKFDRTLWALKRFLLDHLKVPGDDDTPLKELINNALGHECWVFIKWTPSKQDKEVMFDQISKTAPLD